MKKSKSNTTALRWIVNSIKKQIPVVIILIVLSSLLACTGSVAALISKSVIDSAVSGNKDKFIVFAIILASVYIGSILVNALNNYLVERCRASIEMTIKANFFESITHKKYGQISGFHSGMLLNRLTSDTAFISSAAVSILPNVISMIIKLICAFVIIVCFEPWFALIFLVGGLAVFFATRLMRAKLKQLHKNVQSADDKTRSFWHETLTNLLAVKVFSVEDKMNENSDELQKNTFDAKMKRARFSVFTGSGYSGVMYIGYIFAFVWCGTKLLINSVDFTYGTFTAVMQLVGQVQQPFSTISGLIPQYYSALASAERIMEIEMLDDEIFVENDLDIEKIYNSMQKISIRNLTFSYTRDNIFENLNFDINKGEFVAVVGHSGIGKSTLFKIMLGVYSPELGKVEIVCDDKTIPCDNNSRKLFSYVPQGNLLFSGTIRDNITFVNTSADDELINKALEISCANEFVSELPDGLDTIIGEKGLGLSEGQVQRLAIARALVGHSPILLLDEATSALDAVTEAKVLENLRQMKSVTCIIVTHRKQALSICDKKLEIYTTKVEEN